MNDAQRKAFDAYDNWCKDGHPALNTGNALHVAIGYVLNVTDGRPDYDERALLKELAAVLRRQGETVE